MPILIEMNQKLSIKIIKLIFALLFIIPFLSPPYWYFQFLRIVSFLGFAYLAYQEKNSSNKVFLVIFILLAILFQPFEKIALGKEIWLIVDAFSTVILIVSFGLSINSKTNETPKE